MEAQRKLIGKEIHIKLYFLWILVMYMSMAKISAVPSCRAHVCLNWKIQNTRLVLICKVDALDFAITLYDPFDQETGFCVPHEPCIPLLHKAKMTKNNTLHEIIVTIPLQKQLNGHWTCTYGDNNVRAVTEVTLQNVHTETISGHQADDECWILMMVWCMLGFTCSFIPIRLVIFFLTCNGCEKSQRPCKIWTSKLLWKEIGKISIVIVLSITLFVLPLLVGLAKKEKCIAFKEFAIYGAIVGVMICFLLNTVKTDSADEPHVYRKVEVQIVSTDVSPVTGHVSVKTDSADEPHVCGKVEVQIVSTDVSPVTGHVSESFRNTNAEIFKTECVPLDDGKYEVKDYPAGFSSVNRIVTVCINRKDLFPCSENDQGLPDSQQSLPDKQGNEGLPDSQQSLPDKQGNEGLPDSQQSLPDKQGNEGLPDSQQSLPDKQGTEGLPDSQQSLPDKQGNEGSPDRQQSLPDKQGNEGVAAKDENVLLRYCSVI